MWGRMKNCNYKYFLLFKKKSCIIFESLSLKILINQHAGFLHDKDGFWTCPFEGTIIFDEERSMSQWRVVKWRRWKNMQKWANVSEPLGKINQMKFWPTSFWQLCMQPACILHAHLSRLSFSELDWFWWRVFCTHIIWVFSNHQLTSACTFLSWSPECVPTVKIVCSACNLKVQVICGLPDPLPYAGFFMKRRKYNKVLRNSSND